MERRTPFTVLVIAILISSGCRKTATPVTVSPPTIPVETTRDSTAVRDSIAMAEAARRDSLDREALMRADRTSAARRDVVAPVHFDYDQSDLNEVARSILDMKLPVLRAMPAVTLRISGHTDERGSDQYNDALGQRRAAMVMRYLTNGGVDASRIRITSYGESRPLCAVPDERCWSRNRRAEFEITAGFDQEPGPGRGW